MLWFCIYTQSIAVKDVLILHLSAPGLCRYHSTGRAVQITPTAPGIFLFSCFPVSPVPDSHSPRGGSSGDGIGTNSRPHIKSGKTPQWQFCQRSKLGNGISHPAPFLSPCNPQNLQCWITQGWLCKQSWSLSWGEIIPFSPQTASSAPMPRSQARKFQLLDANWGKNKQGSHIKKKEKSKRTPCGLFCGGFCLF